jgi:hypothetical protein
LDAFFPHQLQANSNHYFGSLLPMLAFSQAFVTPFPLAYVGINSSLSAKLIGTTLTIEKTNLTLKLFMAKTKLLFGFYKISQTLSILQT